VTYFKQGTNMTDKMAHSAAIQDWCVAFVAKVLHVPREQIDPSFEVDRLGLDSSTAIALIMALEEHLNIELSPELLFEYPTLNGLSKHIASRLAAGTGA
jgi:acyl carrier protein